MSFDKIQQLVSSLVKSAENNEKIATPILSAKLNKAINSYPGDQTIGAMSRVIGKMASNNTTFISRGDLKTLYNKLYSRNTKFAELFQEELGTIENLATPQIYNRDESVNESNLFEVNDTILSNALNSAFDKDIPLKMYSQSLANKALSVVATTLDAWNLAPTELAIDDGNEKFLVIKANYETPKGITSLFIPIETKNNKAIEASIFMGNSGPQELNNKEIKTYLTTNAGTKLKISGAGILFALTSAASENREISGAEIALTKLNATRQGKSEFFQNSVIGQKMDDVATNDVKLPNSDEFISFEQQFTSPNGQAAWQFGADKVKISRELIIRELTSLGYKNPQVNLTKSDANTIFYSVALDAGKVGFVVPVKITNGKVIEPNVMLCNSSILPFNKDGINNLYVNNSSDFGALAAASPQFGLKPSDIIQNLRSALTESNYAKAEDALNVLKNSGDIKAYATGFKAYMAGLTNKKAEVINKCAHIIHNKTSEHPICSQTGLPVHKTYQDKEGNCRPLFRKGMDETYEGAVFNNSKIFG